MAARGAEARVAVRVEVVKVVAMAEADSGEATVAAMEVAMEAALVVGLVEAVMAAAMVEVAMVGVTVAE